LRAYELFEYQSWKCCCANTVSPSANSKPANPSRVLLD